MDIFLSIALLLAVLSMGAVFIGMRLPKTHLAASRIRLSAPPEEVFAIITDFEAYPSWRPGLDRVERGPDIDGLPSWFEICAKLGRVHFRVTECNSPHRLVTEIVDDKLPLAGLWIYELEASGGGTQLTITEHENIHHPLLRFFDRFILSYFGIMDVYLIALALKLGDSAQPEHLSLRLDDCGLAT
jgi:uncharacterized protein YndB with AHSA1/START domain